MSPENEGLIREVMAREAGRNSLAGYVKYVMDKEAARHHQLICKKLESTLTPGAEKRIVLSAPPGSAKSTYASVAFPSYALAKMPEENLIIAGSYSDELATDFGRKVRNTIKSSEHARLFPDAILAPDNRAADRFSTIRGTTYYATGIGGPITGKRADILLIDDPVKGRVDADSKAKREAAWKWYSSDALTRLKPGGSIVVIGTRWHEDDLIGRILEQAKISGEKWENICLQAICDDPANDPMGRRMGEALWPEWQTLESLRKIKYDSGMSARDWSALYQQRPSPQEGNAVLRKWFINYDPMWLGQNLGRMAIIQSWDTAGTVSTRADPSCCVTAAIDRNGDVYIMDVFKKQMEYTTLRATAIQTYHGTKYRPRAVLVENKGTGQSLYQELKNIGIPVVKINPAKLGDKEFRFEQCTPFIESGKVKVPHSASWADDFVEELVTFPAAMHDDQVDATSQLLNWHLERTVRVRRGIGRVSV